MPELLYNFLTMFGYITLLIIGVGCLAGVGMMTGEDEPASGWWAIPLLLGFVACVSLIVAMIASGVWFI